MPRKAKLIIEITHNEDRQWKFDLEDRLNKIVFIIDGKEIPVMYKIYDACVSYKDEDPKTSIEYSYYGTIKNKFEKSYNKIGLTKNDITPEFLSKVTKIKQIDFKTYDKSCGNTKKWIPDGLRVISLYLVNDEGWIYKVPDHILLTYNFKLKESEMRRKKLQKRKEEKDDIL